MLKNYIEKEGVWLCECLEVHLFLLDDSNITLFYIKMYIKNNDKVLRIACTNK